MGPGRDGPHGEVRAASAAWSYPSATAAFAVLADPFAVHPWRVDARLVDEEQVQSRAVGFYGGWITSKLTGPFKGEPGTMGW